MLLLRIQRSLCKCLIEKSSDFGEPLRLRITRGTPKFSRQMWRCGQMSGGKNLVKFPN